MKLIRLLTATAILTLVPLAAFAGVDGSYLSINPATDQTIAVPPADEIRCFEDAVKVLVVWEVAPDNGVPPGLDWQPADGRMMCATVDNLYALD